MEQVDSAAVYRAASTRFTDGGQMGVGAGHCHKQTNCTGPVGLKQLVTNKCTYVFWHRSRKCRE
jgi:glutamate-5-semialdehyde dehydrogenase